MVCLRGFRNMKVVWSLELSQYSSPSLSVHLTENNRLCSTKIDLFSFFTWFPFLHIICNLLLNCPFWEWCSIVLCWFVSSSGLSFNTLPQWLFIDKNMFLQTLPIFCETTKLSLIKWISWKPQHPWSQKGRWFTCLQWTAVPLIYTSSSSENKTVGLLSLVSF